MDQIKIVLRGKRELAAAAADIAVPSIGRHLSRFGSPLRQRDVGRHK